ncbi:MAG: hypothetical protein N3D20_01230 [Candidatus Pacearchaeota archaeon]|nr:hypothetical protein [Candidatus Pacearchaeota archaeon]
MRWQFFDGKKGQVAIYVIVALVVVGVILGYFLVSYYVGERISPEFQPIYTQYESCIKKEAELAISLAESQGGYVDVPEYVPGSELVPTGNQLNFLGFPVPYWYYVANNGLQKEQVPTKSEIEKQISEYIARKVNNCNFEKYYGEGFLINLSDVSNVWVSISNNVVRVDVNVPLLVYKEGGGSARRSKHSVEINSKIGKLYDDAIKIYNKENKDLFLEKYGIDVLRAYAPVDGVELGCSGKVWKTREVIEELREALSANIGAISFGKEKKGNYFVVASDIGSDVNLIYSRRWPTKIEIHGADEELMIAEPVGMQEGMGVMGFCYAPYHFVYDIYYPVLIQVSDGMETFQFAMVAVIDKNLPREGVYSEIISEEEMPDICAYKTQNIEVNVYDVNLNRLDAEISYQCLNQRCRLGESVDGRFVGKAPACYNGILITKKEGYFDNKQIFSTNEEVVADVIMDKEYNVELEVKSGGKVLNEMALVIFDNGQRQINAVLPEVKNVKLAEGFYNVSVYVYSNSSLVLPATTKEQCVEEPKGALGGFFGLTERKCYNVEIPETKIENALIGGGRGEIYLLTSDLERDKLKLEVGLLDKPNSLEELQKNFELFEALSVGVEY